MARLSDLPEWERQHHLSKIPALPDYGITPGVSGPLLNERRVAIVTTAGLHLLGIVRSTSARRTTASFQPMHRSPRW